MNVFTLKLTDASGQPVKDATVTLPGYDEAVGWTNSKDPWMPLMNHGSSIAPPPVTNNGNGTYGVSVYLSMAGLWQIYIVAQTTDGLTDSAEYSSPCLQCSLGAQVTANTADSCGAAPDTVPPEHRACPRTWRFLGPGRSTASRGSRLRLRRST